MRSLHHLLHGRLNMALAMNPLFVVSIPVSAALALSHKLLYHPATPKTALLVFALFGIARNLPFHPFVLLAPV